jgi:hypothetical protein
MMSAFSNPYTFPFPFPFPFPDSDSEEESGTGTDGRRRLRITPSYSGVLAPLALLALGGCALFGKGAPERTLTWDLASEFRAGPDASNPLPDRYGNAEVWHFLRSTRFEGPPGERRWRRDGRYEPLAPAEGHFGKPPPSVNGAAAATAGTLAPRIGRVMLPRSAETLAASDVVLQPGAENAAVVGWRCPIAGTLEVAGLFECLEGGGESRGAARIEWHIERGPAPARERGFTPVPLSRGTAVRGSPTQRGTFYIRDLEVTAGDFIYFVVDPHADGSDAPERGDAAALDVRLTLRAATLEESVAAP